MAAGSLVDQYGQTLTVNSSGCSDVLASYAVFFSGSGITPDGCTSDPVIAGTTISFHRADGSPVSAVIQSIAATAPAPAPAAPSSGTGISCGSACTVTVKHEFSAPPFQLEAGQGAQVALAVIAVWVVGWSIRMFIRAMSSGDSHPESSQD